MNVNQYDIVLDLLIVNQTSDTLQNVTLELATLGKMISDSEKRRKGEIVSGNRSKETFLRVLCFLRFSLSQRLKQANKS